MIELIDHAIAPIQEKYTGFYQLLLFELERLRKPEGTEDDIYQQFLSFFATATAKTSTAQNGGVTGDL